MTKRIDLTGQSFGHLVVIAPAETRGGRAYWHCQCDCGRVTTGVRGVCYLKNKEVYRASITFQGQKYHLLESHSLEECKKALQEAEEHIFDDFLAWYDQREAERKGKS